LFSPRKKEKPRKRAPPTRLFNEIAQKGRELEIASQHKSQNRPDTP
jgi:hypothetical protein